MLFLVLDLICLELEIKGHKLLANDDGDEEDEEDEEEEEEDEEYKENKRGSVSEIELEEEEEENCVIEKKREGSCEKDGVGLHVIEGEEDEGEESEVEEESEKEDVHVLKKRSTGQINEADQEGSDGLNEFGPPKKRKKIQ